MTKKKITAKYCKGLRDKYKAEEDKRRQKEAVEREKAFIRSIFINDTSAYTFEDLLEDIKEAHAKGTVYQSIHLLKKEYVQKLRDLGFYYYADIYKDLGPCPSIYTHVRYLISAEEITCKGMYCLTDITQDDDYENYDETEFLYSYIKKEHDKEQYMREEILAHDSLIELNEEDTLQGWLVPVLVFCAFALTYFICTGISSLIGG